MTGRWTVVAACLLGAALTACDSDGITRPPATNLLVIHAAPDLPNIDFRREQRTETTLSYTESAPMSFDSGQYDFNLDTTRPDGRQERLGTFSRTLAPEPLHIFVLTRQAGTVVPLTYEVDAVASGATTSQIIVMHAGANQGAYDVYFEAPGTDLGTVAPLGTLALAQDPITVDLAAGDYELTLTEPGNAANALLRTPVISLTNGLPTALTILDGPGNGAATAAVLRIDSANQTLIDVNSQGNVRFLNTVADQADRDVYLDGDFSAPFAAGLSFGTITDYRSVAGTGHDFTFTPAGNPSVEELVAPLSARGGLSYLIMITGNTTDGLIGSIHVEDRRSISGQARMQFANGSDSFLLIDFFIVPPGTDITGQLPSATIPVGEFGAMFDVPVGDFEVTLRSATSDVIIAGPIPVTLADGGVYSMLAVDAVGGSTADVILYNDFN